MQLKRTKGIKCTDSVVSASASLVLSCKGLDGLSRLVLPLWFLLWFSGAAQVSLALCLVFFGSLSRPVSVVANAATRNPPVAYRICCCWALRRCGEHTKARPVGGSLPPGVAVASPRDEYVRCTVSLGCGLGPRNLEPLRRLYRHLASSTLDSVATSVTTSTSLALEPKWLEPKWLRYEYEYWS